MDKELEAHFQSDAFKQAQHLLERAGSFHPHEDEVLGIAISIMVTNLVMTNPTLMIVLGPEELTALACAAMAVGVVSQKPEVKLEAWPVKGEV